MKKVLFYKTLVSRILVLVVLDILSIALSLFLAIYVRFDLKFSDIPVHYIDGIEKLLPFILPITLLIFWIWRLYKSVWRYASANELINIFGAVCVSILALVICNRQFKTIMPRSFFPLYGFALFILVCGVRFSYRILRVFNIKRQNMFSNKTTIRVMIVGAGAAGNAILKEIETSQYLTMKVVCLIDDNAGCHGKILRGVPIVGGRDKIIEAVSEHTVDEIIIAIPSAAKRDIKEILEVCKDTECKLRMLPGMYQLIKGEVAVSQLREVQIEDLLGRDTVKVDIEEIINYVQSKRVLVTGGGGSIGSELCRQIAMHRPAQLIIVDIYENNAYEIQQELLRKHPELDLVVLVASVRNTNRINSIFETYRPQIVYHAAAHKHVPLMEDSPNEAIKNNVFGTYKTALAADKFDVERFVLISTDKAVNPTNIMGASKRICEMVIQMVNRHSKTSFVAVRFGNVLGSNGSVIPLFKKQIAEGGPVTVTHPDIIRYFMTIPEAVSLVLQAGAYARGGEIFVLDMGEPVKIAELAQNLIKLSGYRVGEDIEIRYTGLRPGEKMYEELLMDEEGLKKTSNDMIYIGKAIEIDEEIFKKDLMKLKELSDRDDLQIKEIVKCIVPTYENEEKEE